MTPKLLTIEKMWETPGFYAVSRDFDRLSVPANIVEMESDGTCHQIKPSTMQRDGALSYAGWDKDAKALGPFTTGSEVLENLQQLWKQMLAAPIKRVYTE